MSLFGSAPDRLLLQSDQNTQNLINLFLHILNFMKY
jgi:hypothetical protein